MFRYPFNKPLFGLTATAIRPDKATPVVSLSLALACLSGKLYLRYLSLSVAPSTPAAETEPARQQHLACLYRPMPVAPVYLLQRTWEFPVGHFEGNSTKAVTKWKREPVAYAAVLDADTFHDRLRRHYASALIWLAAYHPACGRPDIVLTDHHTRTTLHWT